MPESRPCLFIAWQNPETRRIRVVARLHKRELEGREVYEFVYVKELGLSSEDASPETILARSGGHRATDHFELFAPPRLCCLQARWPEERLPLSDERFQPIVIEPEAAVGMGTS